jgi:hypothetical protein
MCAAHPPWLLLLLLSLRKCNGVLRSWRREGEAPIGCCYFASEAMPFTLFFVLAAGLGVFLIRNEAGT